MKRRIALLLLVLLVSAAAGLLMLRSSGSAGQLREYSGTIETREIQVGSKVAGRVTEVLVEEGQLVSAGTPMVRFEADELRAQRQQLQARVEQAAAELRRLESGYRPEEVLQAEAAAQQQRALLDAAKAGPRDQEVQQAHAEYAATKAEATNAELEFQRMEALFKSGDIARQRYDDSLARRESSAQRAEAARQRLSLLQAGTRAEELRAAEERFRQAQASARLVRTGFRKEDIAAARGRLAEAQARLAEFDVRVQETELKSPASAVVQIVSVRPGDLVQPNRIVATMLEPSQLWVKMYVPEPELGRVAVGQAAAVRVDSFPGRTFEGRIEQISAQAEFLPRNVQTRDDREHQVFGVKVRVANPGNELKSGMSAIVRIP